jgi:hypothetical protein
MDSVVTALTGVTGITSTTFFDVIVDLVPLLVLIIPIALGLYFLRKIVKGLGKGKVKF